MDLNFYISYITLKQGFQHLSLKIWQLGYDVIPAILLGGRWQPSCPGPVHTLHTTVHYTDCTISLKQIIEFRFGARKDHQDPSPYNGSAYISNIRSFFLLFIIHTEILVVLQRYFIFKTHFKCEKSS